jgi:hypothetical protein
MVQHAFPRSLSFEMRQNWKSEKSLDGLKRRREMDLKPAFVDGYSKQPLVSFPMVIKVILHVLFKEFYIIIWNIIIIKIINMDNNDELMLKELLHKRFRFLRTKN